MLIMTVREGRARLAGHVPYIATTVWEGETFEAHSATGSSMALARKLVSADCPDQPWQTCGPDGKLRTFGPSLHRLATLMVQESHGIPRIGPVRFRGDTVHGVEASAGGSGRVSD